MSIYRNLALTAPRARFVDAQPELQPAHRAAQKAMFGVAGKAGLSHDPFQMRDGINALLGTSFSSRAQMTPDEMDAVSAAIEAGAFNSDWTLSGLVRAEITVHVQISLLPCEAPLCGCCGERPVAYRLCDERGDLLPGSGGVCRECAPSQIGDEEGGDESTPASEGTIEEAAREWERIAGAEESREAAYAQALGRVEYLRGRVRFVGRLLCDVEAHLSRENARNLRRFWNEAKAELRDIECEYPFI